MKNTAWFAAAVMMLWGSGALAGDVTWTNTAPGGAAWETGSNWDTGTPPGPADRAVVANGGKAIVNSTFSITNMLLQSKSTLRVESGAMTITDPAANAIKFANGGGTSYVEQVGGTLELAAAQAAYWGYGNGNTFHGRFSGGSMICSNTTGSAWLGIGNQSAAFDVELSGSAWWNVATLRIGYGAGTASPRTFRQTGSSVVTGGTLVLGYQGGLGTCYYMDNGTNSHGTVTIDGSKAGPVTMIVNGGVVSATGGGNSFNLGYATGSDGSLTISNGTLDVVSGNTICGYNGLGTLTVRGGAVSLRPLLLGWQTDGTGVVNVVNGAEINLNGNNIRNQVNAGFVNLGDASSFGSLTNVGTVLCGENGREGRMTVRGWGTLTTSGGFNWLGTNTAQVVADGYGAADRTLTVAGSATVNHSTTPASGSGWYARNRGKLLLPDHAVGAGDVTVNWANRAADLINQLVNSVQFDFTGASAGTLSGALLATDRSDVLPGLNDPIGVWEFSGPAFTSATLRFRYDAAAAAGAGIAETDLRIMHSSGSAWNDITGSVDTNARCILSTAITSLGSPSQFAVTGPPPPLPLGTTILLR